LENESTCLEKSGQVIDLFGIFDHQCGEKY